MNSTLTYREVMGDVEVPAHLAADAEVPVVNGKPQRQGDVMVIPMRKGKVAGLLPVPAEGIPVVRGEAGGNTHLLLAEGTVTFAPSTDRAICGTLLVEKDSTAFLVHPEHGAQGIGEGTYLVRRQREQADEIRIVAD